MENDAGRRSADRAGVVQSVGAHSRAAATSATRGARDAGGANELTERETGGVQNGTRSATTAGPPRWPPEIPPPHTPPEYPRPPAYPPVPIVYVSHDREEVDVLADVVVMLEAGRVVSVERLARVELPDPTG